MRRLLDKRGSVLFLVVVVMSILIIAASATYYIVNNQHSSVNVRYSSEQSYQTAVSVSKTVSDYIDGYISALCKSGKEMGKYKNTLVGKMLSMSTGTTNDITSSIPLDAGMGTAKVTIRKAKTTKKGDDTIHIFEITTDSVVNGEVVSITQVKEIVVGPTEYFTRFLTSTGYHQEDVSITANEIISAAFFENEFTRLANAVMNDSIYSSGTFSNDGITFNAPTKEIVIAENFYNNGWGNPLTCGKVYVGGNMESNSSITASGIYILGDLTLNQDQSGATFYVNGDLYLNNVKTQGCIFYVNGSVYFNNIQKAQGKFYVLKNVVINNWVSNNVEECKYGGSMIGTTSASGFTQDTGITTPPFADAADKASYISTVTGKQKYDKWDAETYFVKTFTNYVDNVQFNADGSVRSYDIKNSIIPGQASDTWTPDDDIAYKPAWVDGNAPIAGQRHTYLSAKYGAGKAICYINESCALQSWSNTGFNDYYPNGGNNSYLVIDTGVSRVGGKELYILLDKGSNPYFSFGADNTIQGVNVIIKGDYPVIFILPEGTDYKASPFMYIGHANLAVDLCGCTSYSDLTSVKRSIFNFCKDDPSTCNAVNKIKSYIKTIPSGVDGILPTAIIDVGNTVLPAGSAVNCIVPDFHNNIFLVTNSKSCDIDMAAQSVFYGYLYAPFARFSIHDNGGGNGNNIKFLGGMIVGSYYYNQFGGALAYLTPYDYKDVYELKDSSGNSKPTDIVKHLIKVANGALGGSGVNLDNSIIKPSIGISPTVGYK